MNGFRSRQVFISTLLEVSMMPVLKKSERTPRLGTIKGGMEAVMVRATTGRRAGSRKGCKLSFKSSRNSNSTHVDLKEKHC